MYKFLLMTLLMSCAFLHRVEAISTDSTPSITVEAKQGSLSEKQRKQEKKLKKKGGNVVQAAPVRENRDFISAVVNGKTQNQQTVAPGNPIIFNTTCAQGSTITNSDSGVFTATAPGIYEVTYGAKWTSDHHSYVALRVNGKILEASRISFLSTMSIIVDASKNSKTTFELINDSLEQPASSIELIGDSLGSSSSGFITIKRIN